MIDPTALAEQLLDAARKAGAEAADAIAMEREDLGVAVRAGALEEAERSESVDFGLRVLIGARQACVSASDPRPAVLAELAERAVAMAREAPEDPHCGLPGADQIAADWPDLDLSDPTVPPAPATLEDTAREVETAAKAVPGVSQTESCSASWGRASIYLAATNGFSGGYSSSRSGFSASAIAGEGLRMESDWDYASRRHAADLPDPASVGRKAGMRAAERLGGKKPPSGAYPVIFDARVAPSIVGHVIGAVNGAAIARGSSWLLEKMGAPILPQGVEIFEDPLIARGPASRPFDGEGLATRAKKIVEDGVLTTWLLDCRSARKLGLASTGNASRGLSSPPGVGSTNIRLTTGALNRAALIKETGTGLLVTSMMGRGVNPTTGDYSRGASGFWIEEGEIAYPVNEATIAGPLPEALLTLTAADDIDLSKASAAPSIRLEGLTIAGD